jgi:transposase
MAVSTQMKAEVVQLMEAGHSWQEALAQVGVAVCESTTYIWRRRWREGGEVALVDQRRGYRHKMTDEIRAWLQAYCEAAPHTPSSQLRQELRERFGVAVSKGHVNLLRFQMSVSRPKKNRNE